MLDKIGKHSVPLSGIFINIIATVYAVFNPVMGKELFTLYGISAGGLYGYSQQQRVQEIEDSEQGSRRDS